MKKKIFYIFKHWLSCFTRIDSMDIFAGLHFYFFTMFQVRKPKLKWLKLLHVYTFFDLTWLFCIQSSHFLKISSQVVVDFKKFSSQVKSSQSRVESSHKSSQVISENFQVKSSQVGATLSQVTSQNSSQVKSNWSSIRFFPCFL